MDFNHGRAQFRRHFDLLRRCSDKKGNADAGVLEFMNDRGKLCALLDGIEPTFGGPFSAFFGHQTDRVWSSLERNADHFRGRCHLKIERLVDFRFQASNIVVANVATIFAKVCGNPIAAGRDRKLGSAHRIRMAPTAGIADSGDMIDINAKAETVHALR